MIQKIFQRQDVRFLAIGGLNFAWGLVSYPIFFELLRPSGINYLWILVFTYVVNTFISFASQKYLVFRTEGKHLQELSKFGLLQICLLLINLVALPLLISATGWSPVVLQPIFALFIALCTFFVHKFFTFKRAH